MLGTASANAPEYQPVASKSPERKDDVLENICPARAQLESKHADVSFPPVQSVGGNAESNNQEEQEVHSKNKHCMFRNNTARHIWLKYMRLMTGKKQDENHENTSCGEEVEKMSCLARLDTWLMTGLECLELDENRVENIERNLSRRLRNFFTYQ